MRGVPSFGDPLRSRRRTPWVLMLALVAALCAGGGCALVGGDLAYYWQSASGHLSMMQRARPIDDLVEDPSLDPALRARLLRVLEIRAFASSELALPSNGSYRSYADLDRPFVVWNVFATPELSMQLRQWCFPVAGCVSYRGYFDRARAEEVARALRAEGLEAYVAGIPAYSTLGWFDDPVLNTFIRYPEGELARLIFHELAHQVLYVKGDTTFNESFATAVEEVGVERWLAARGDPEVVNAYRVYAARRAQFVALLRRAKGALEQVFAGGGSDADRRVGKAAVFAALREEYAALKTSWGGYAGYDRWFAQDLTNAHLASVATYHALVPGFRRMISAEGGDLKRFFDAARALSRRDKAERDQILLAPVADEPTR